MEAGRQEEFEEDEINLGEWFAALRTVWWKIVAISVGIGIATLLWMLQRPNYYLASATITPAADEGKQSPSLGALASFGVSVGGPTKVEDLEALFKSNDLTIRVFKKYDLWPTVMPDRFDPKTGKLKIGWLDRLLGRESTSKPPGDWDAVRAAQNALGVSINRKNGNLSISFETRSPEGSASIVRYYLEEAKSRLQEEALDRALKNKKFIEGQIGRTSDALTRDRMYSLYGQEVEKEMMARNREQFGFRTIDSPRVPDRKSRPHRAKTSLLATTLSFLVLTFAFLVWRKRELPQSHPPKNSN
ncbi:MAG: Wzz/FepE/Etk N-terminal domain-containing protein [Deltaproteobacteria bacterium]|nr:Wzz/FepE/Etk N-terminal domain-containing protein [Deltaproteobacteria bacterium]